MKVTFPDGAEYIAEPLAREGFYRVEAANWSAEFSSNMEQIFWSKKFKTVQENPSLSEAHRVLAEFRKQLRKVKKPT